MRFISMDDFYQKAKGQKNLSREGKILRYKMDNGDADAHNKRMPCYLPMVVL